MILCKEDHILETHAEYNGMKYTRRYYSEHGRVYWFTGWLGRGTLGRLVIDQYTYNVLETEYADWCEKHKQEVADE